MTVKINNRNIGPNEPCFIIGEIGINHNGDVEIAKELIEQSIKVGADAVKFQKRDIEIVYSKEELDKDRKSVFGEKNRDLKQGLEFGEKEYNEINNFCKNKILWTSSCWDLNSLKFISNYKPKFLKIASASLTDIELLKAHKDIGIPIILSTGMSDLDQIGKALSYLDKNNTILLHCTSTYPCKIEEINLQGIKTLINEFKIPVGYSGHETGVSTTVNAVAMGACVIERHITLDRSNWGSDQAASLEIQGFSRLIRDIRSFEKAKGDGEIIVFESEKEIIKKLRRIKDF
jgi:N-acetylneuraminate synthase